MSRMVASRGLPGKRASTAELRATSAARDLASMARFNRRGSKYARGRRMAWLGIASTLLNGDDCFHVYHLRRCRRTIRQFGNFDSAQMLTDESLEDATAAEGRPRLHVRLYIGRAGVG